VIRRAFVCVAVATIAVLLTAGVASAHANLASSDPANGATLATPPSQIRLTFTEPPDPSLSTIQVLDAGGTVLQTGAVALEPPRTLSASMRADMPDGVYTVSWRTVSTMDGHVTAGAFAFGVGKISGPITPGASTIGASSSGPTLLSVTAKTALYAGLMLLVAAPVVGLWLFRREPGALRVVGVTGALIAFGGAIGMLLSEQHTVGVSIDDLLRTTTGRPYGWLVVATLAAAICTLIAAARARWLPALWDAGTAAGVAMAIRIASGHAAAAPDALLQQGFGWLHFLAAGLWIGGLVLLLLLLRERLRGSKVPPSAEARRFSNLALAAVSVVAVTGALRAVSELGGLSNVLDGLHRAYGITLLAKVAVALVLIALGATNRLRNVILVAENPRPLRTFVAAETVFALGVLVLTGALTGLNPPASLATAQPGPAPVSGTATGADFATTTQVSLTAAPGSPGPNAFDAAVTDYDTGAVLPADAVSLRFLSVTHPELPASQLRLTQQSDGGWTGQGIAMSVAGTWRVTTLIRSGATTTEVPLTLITVNGGSTSTVAIAGAPSTTTTSFPDGVSLQSFVEQATAGPNPVHVTAFGPDGNELPLRTAAIVVNPTNGEPIRPPLQRFSAGHLVANTTLDAGDYVIDIVATARSGQTYQSTWPLTIAPAAAGSASAG
jgi:copper transport protein